MSESETFGRIFLVSHTTPDQICITHKPILWINTEYSLYFIMIVCNYIPSQYAVMCYDIVLIVCVHFAVLSSACIVKLSFWFGYILCFPPLKIKIKRQKGDVTFTIQFTT